jgi:hypothetical protein
MVKISYAICVCNEHREIESLVNFLLKVKDAEDEINILVDSGKVTLRGARSLGILRRQSGGKRERV